MPPRNYSAKIFACRKNEREREGTKNSTPFIIICADNIVLELCEREGKKDRYANVAFVPVVLFHIIPETKVKIRNEGHVKT